MVATNQLKSNTEPWHFVCCGKRFDANTKSEITNKQRQHNKTINHKINQAVADFWIEKGKFFLEREKALIEAFEGGRQTSNNLGKVKDG